MEALPTVEVPTLVLPGGDDLLLPVGNGEMIAEGTPEAVTSNGQAISSRRPGRPCASRRDYARNT